MLVTAMCEPHGVLGCEQCAMPVVVTADPPEDRACRKWVGPIWKSGGETCVCKLRADHSDGQFGADHECECGSWFVDSVAHPWDSRSSPRTVEPS